MNSKYRKFTIQKPNRVKHCRTISSPVSREEVFPLLCPVREIDWAPGWLPDFVISNSGLVEQDCIFQTPDDDSHKNEAATWVVTKHDPELFEVEMFKVIPQHTVSKLQISLEAGSGGGTLSKISFEYTSLGLMGDAFIDECDDQWYENMMQHWETAMNSYLLRTVHS